MELLVDGEKDVNVPFRQSDNLYKALKRTDTQVEFVEYEYAEHSIEQERYRIDLLARLGKFLDRHLTDK